MISEYLKHDGVGLAELVRRGDVTASELMEAAITLTDGLDPTLNFVAVDCRDLGYQQARQPLPQGRLSGLPYLLKDTFTAWEGTVTTNGCKLFKDYVSPGDSGTVTRAKAAGLLLFAKSTVPEWAWALSTETLLHGDTLNPWDMTRTPGGSSGGAASAVAAGVVPLANGSDGGGSIRVPAAYSGLVGLKPTRGRISWGPDMIEVVSGMAQEGCVSRSVRDQAAYLDIMHGQLPGERDLPSAPVGTFEEALDKPLRTLRIGFTAKSTSHVQTYAAGVAGVHRAAAFCEVLGHHVEEMNFDSFDYMQAYSHVRGVFGLGHLAAFEMGRELKGSEPSGTDFMRFMFESARSSASLSALDHTMNVQGLRIGAHQIISACAPYDIVLTPMTVAPPPKIGFNHMHTTELNDYHATLRDHGMPFSVPFNISGQPACSIPIDLDQLGLPVGLQIVGRYGDDATVLQLAAEFERGLPWRDRHPGIWAGDQN